MALPEDDSDSASLSALSEVDESILNASEHWRSSLKVSKKVAGRPRNLKVTGVDARDKTHGRAALHKASARGNLDKVKELIETKGATIDITDNAGVTPLHDACTSGHVKVVQYLVDAGANVSPKDCEGDYPLLDAAQNDNEQICQILLDAGANPTMQNSSGMSALSEAEEGSLKDLLRQYSSRFDSPGQNRMKITDVLSSEETPTGKGHLKEAARLRASRSSKLNIDARGARKVDINGRDQLHQYVLEQDDDLVEQFLEIQDTDHQDHYGDTPLHAASYLCNAHICGLLLQHGADVSLKNKKGNTALHEASYTEKSREVIVALLDAGASSLIRNGQGQTAADIALEIMGAHAPEVKLLEKTIRNELQKAEDKERRRVARRERNGSASESAKSTPLQSPKVSREKESSNSTPVNAKAHPSSHNHVSSISAATLPASQAVSAADVAITVSTAAPPEIVTTKKQVVTSGLPATQFLTELKTNRLLSQIDSSIRGSPLPLPPVPQITASRPAANARSSSLDHTATPAHPETTLSEPAAISPNGLKRKSVNGGDPAHAQKRPKPIQDTERSQTATNINAPPSRREGQERLTGETNDIAAAVAQMGRDIVAAIENQNELLVALLRGINTLVQAQQSDVSDV